MSLDFRTRLSDKALSPDYHPLAPPPFDDDAAETQVVSNYLHTAL